MSSALTPENYKELQRSLLRLGKCYWPKVRLFDKQKEVVRSVERDDETFVRAVNQVGKDFVASYIIITFFTSRRPCRVLTTSATERHLDVLWAEINTRVRTSAVPLLWPQGRLLLRQRKITRMTKVDGRWEECPVSYIVGKVAGPDSLDAMGGHHVAHRRDGIPRTLFVADEASSVEDEYYRRTRPWAKRSLIFGNTWDCQNFFRQAFEGKPGTEDRGGDIVAA